MILYNSRASAPHNAQKAAANHTKRNVPASLPSVVHVHSMYIYSGRALPKPYLGIGVSLNVPHGFVYNKKVNSQGFEHNIYGFKYRGCIFEFFNFRSDYTRLSDFYETGFATNKKLQNPFLSFFLSFVVFYLLIIIIIKKK